MTDTSSRGLSTLSGSHNPFDDPRPKRQKGFWIAIVIAVVVHAARALPLEEQVRAQLQGVLGRCDGRVDRQAGAATSASASASAAAEHAAAAAAKAAAAAAGCGA